MGGRNAAVLTVLSMLVLKAKSVICVTKARVKSSGKKKGCNVHPIKERYSKPGRRSAWPHLV
jgi:hypothetical protein